MEPSKKQAEIAFTLGHQDTGVIITRAVAGCGKTTTVSLLAKCFPDWKFLVLQYNKKLQSQSEKRFSSEGVENINTLTIHKLARDVIDFFVCWERTNGRVAETVLKVPNTWKSCVDNYMEISSNCLEAFALEFPNMRLQQHNDSFNFDVIVIDEAQDLKPSMFRFIFLFLLVTCTTNTRLILLGDHMQSIHNFGEDPSHSGYFVFAHHWLQTLSLILGLPHLSQISVFKLDTCYRIPPSILQFLNCCVFSPKDKYEHEKADMDFPVLLPWTKFKTRWNEDLVYLKCQEKKSFWYAWNGEKFKLRNEYNTTNQDQVFYSVADSESSLYLIDQTHPYFKQFSICKLLINWIKIKKRYAPRDVLILVPSVSGMAYSRSAKKTPACSLYDNLRKAGIDAYSSDEKNEMYRNAVCFSTYHAAKGVEAKLVVVLGIDSSWQKFWNKNITNKEVQRCPKLWYVAMTRAMECMVLCWSTTAEFSRLPFLRIPAQKKYKYSHEIITPKTKIQKRIKNINDSELNECKQNQKQTHLNNKKCDKLNSNGSNIKNNECKTQHLSVLNNGLENEPSNENSINRTNINLKKNKNKNMNDEENKNINDEENKNKNINDEENKNKNINDDIDMKENINTKNENKNNAIDQCPTGIREYVHSISRAHISLYALLDSCNIEQKLIWELTDTLQHFVQPSKATIGHVSYKTECSMLIGELIEKLLLSNNHNMPLSLYFTPCLSSKTEFLLYDTMKSIVQRKDFSDAFRKLVTQWCDSLELPPFLLHGFKLKQLVQQWKDALSAVYGNNLQEIILDIETEKHVTVHDIINGRIDLFIKWKCEQVVGQDIWELKTTFGGNTIPNQEHVTQLLLYMESIHHSCQGIVRGFLYYPLQAKVFVIRHDQMCYNSTDVCRNKVSFFHIFQKGLKNAKEQEELLRTQTDSVFLQKMNAWTVSFLRSE